MWRIQKLMTLGDGIRRNVAKISPEERKRLSDAFIKLDTTKFYPDGVSYWDKQEDIHKNAHAGGSDVHGGPAFIPWHREICNRLEALLREVDPELSLHYWDWTTDPRGNGADLANLFTADFMGGTGDPAGPPFQDFESTEPGHSKIWRDVNSGAPGVESDSTILAHEDFQAFRVAVESSHDTAHGYIGGSIGNQHFSFHDPFVFLLHSNVDRLWAMWQTATGKSWRLNPDLTYGIEGSSPASTLNTNVEPWAGDVGTGVPPLRPWTAPDNQQVVKTYKHLSIITPPWYDTTLHLAHITKIEFTIKTGNDQQANAGADSKVFCGIAGREFRLEKTGVEFDRNTNETIVAGNGANISNPALNDPNNPELLLDNLPNGTKPQPLYIRYVPSDQNKGWQLENATVKVFGQAGLPPSGFFEFKIIGYSSTNRWLGEKFGTAVWLAISP
jgi:hypothetical protein